MLDGVINENKVALKKRKRVLDQTMGVDELPVLQNVEYKVGKHMGFKNHMTKNAQPNSNCVRAANRR